MPLKGVLTGHLRDRQAEGIKRPVENRAEQAPSFQMAALELVHLEKMSYAELEAAWRDVEVVTYVS